MKLEYVPVLHVQQRLQGLPRSFARFAEYLKTIRTMDGQGLQLPALVAMNPMGKEHVTALVDALIALDADGLAAQLVADTSRELVDLPGEFKVTLVVSDDLKGGWTNRYASEFHHRFRSGPPAGPEFRRPHWTEHLWITALYWTSEPAEVRLVREAVLATIYRTAYLLQHPPGRTLRDMMRQEGHVLARAGCERPTLDADDLEYTREVIAPYLETTDPRVAMECLFGDEAGRTLGFTPRGLSPWAGLALALQDARMAGTPL